MVKPNWDSIQLYFSGDEYFLQVLSAINQAQKEIILESYIFDLDPIGLRILHGLRAAKDRGVHVQILVDGVGSFNWTWNLHHYCLENQIHFRIFNPLPLNLDIIRKLSWKNLRRVLFLLRKINKRNHRKIILIDRQVAFLGSLNVSQVHTTELMGKLAWRDTGIQVQGGPLPELRRSCIDAWISARVERLFWPHFLWRRKKRIQLRPNDVLRLNSTLKWRYSLLRDLNRRLGQAERRILITNAYFLPRLSILRSLRKAAQKGVYVGICLPAISDVPIIRWASRSMYHRLLRSGIHIFEYQERMLHAKTLIIDNWATVGSFNLNHRSLTHDLEVEVALNKQEWVDSMVRQWDEDLKQCREIQVSDLGQTTWRERLLSNTLYWFRYWL